MAASWSRIPARDPVTERPPGWFVGMLSGLLATAVWGLLRIRVRSLRVRERDLALRVEQELQRVRVLQGLIPICAGCKKIRDDAGYSTQLEEYIAAHSEADFSHGFCPVCIESLYGEWLPHRFPNRRPNSDEGGG